MSKKQFSVGRPMMWVGVAVLSAGLAVGAWFLKSSGVETGVKSANKAAAASVKKHLVPSLDASDVREPMSEEASADLQEIVEDRILDEDTTTVRIWTASGTLVYSSTGEETGTRGGDERGIRLATSGEGKTTSIVPASQLGVLDVYTPLRVGAGRRSEAAVEVIDEFAPIFAAAGQPWNLVQSIAGGLAAIALLLAGISFALLRVGRVGTRDGGFARPGSSADEEKLRRTIGARDEQLTQLRTQLREQETETVERIRELEIQLRDAAAKAIEAESRSGDTAGLSEAAQEANRRAQELLDRAVRAEGEVSALREQLKDAPVGDSKEAEHRIQVLEEQLRTVGEERDRAATDLRTLEATARDTEARFEELAQRAEDLKTTMATKGQGDDEASEELRRTVEEMKISLADSERARHEAESVATEASTALASADATIAALQEERELLRGDVESDKGETAVRLVQAEARVTELERSLVEARDRTAEIGRERDEAVARSAGLEVRFEEASSKAEEADARSQSLEGRIQDMAKNAGSATEGLKLRLGELEARASDAESQQKDLLARTAEAEAAAKELTVLVSAAKARETELMERSGSRGRREGPNEREPR